MVKDLTVGSPTKLILRFSMAMLLSSITSYLYSLTDSIMVSHFVHPDALGAISAAGPSADLIEVLFFGVIGGFPILAGQVFGSGDTQKLRNVMANATYLSIAVIGLATLISTVFCRPLVLMMNTPAGFVDMAVTYYFIRAFGNLISGVTRVCTNMFCALGDSKTVVYASLVGSLSNIAFNALFMGVCGMGIEGAALGTVCAQVLSAIFCFVILKTGMRILLFGKKDAKISIPTMKTLLANGLPLGLQSGIVVFGTAILQFAINGHGELAVTGISIGSRVLLFVWMIFQSFEGAILYFCAQNVGAGKLARVRRGIKNTLLINLGIGAGCAILLFFFSDYLFMLFAGDRPDIIGAAKTFLFSQIVFFPAMVTLSIWRGGVKGLGSTVPAVACGIIELASRAFVSVFFSGNLTMLFMAGPLAWVGTSVFLAILYPRTLKKCERNLEEARAAREAETAESVVAEV